MPSHGRPLLHTLIDHPGEQVQRDHLIDHERPMQIAGSLVLLAARGDDFRDFLQGITQSENSAAKMFATSSPKSAGPPTSDQWPRVPGVKPIKDSP